MNLKLTFILILISILGFSQEKILKKVTLKDYNFIIIENQKTDDKNTLFYEIRRVVNDSIVQQIYIDKDPIRDDKILSSEFKIIDNTFIFSKTYNINNSIYYGIDRVIIGKFGKLYFGIENGNISKEKPEENTYSAQFDGGLIKLREWIQNHFSSYKIFDIIQISKLNIQISLLIDRNGKPNIKEVLGNSNSKLKLEIERIINKMPNWIPAKTNNEYVESIINIPVQINYNE